MATQYWETVANQHDTVADADLRTAMREIVFPGLRELIESAAATMPATTIFESDANQQAVLHELIHALTGSASAEFMIHFTQLSTEHAEALYK